MARQINAGDGVKVTRSDTFFVAPSAICVDWNLNGRTDTFTPENIARLAADLRDNGQLQPIGCRPLPDKRPQLIYGFNRLRAGLLIEQENPEFKLEIKVYDGINDRDAFVMNIRENMIRTDTSPIDNATNIRKLLNQFGFTPQEVAALYKKSPTWVTQTVKLLTLPEPVKDAVAAGELSQSAATILTQLPEADAAAALAEGVAVVEAEDAAERAEENVADMEPLPLETETHVNLTVDDESLADAIGKLPTKPKAAGGTTKRKPARALTPAEVQSRKTARQARISAATTRAAAAKGVKVARQASDLKAILKFRKDDVSRMILEFLAGDASEDELSEALDMCPTITGAAGKNGKTTKPIGPVTKL